MSEKETFEIDDKLRIKAALGELVTHFIDSPLSKANTELTVALYDVIKYLGGSRELLELNYANIKRAIKKYDDWAVKMKVKEKDRNA